MKKTKARTLFIILIVLWLSQLTGCGETPRKEIIVSAAASLQEVMNEIVREYAEDKKDVKIIMNFGSSGTLQNQIEQGAPVDVFISAGKRQMDVLETKSLLLANTRIDLLGNEMVLITAKDNNMLSSLDDLTKPELKQIAIGTPETVPAGKYAKEALVSLGYWDSLAPKYVFAKDVKQVLAYVETGNAEAGIAYLSDSRTSDKVKVVLAIPPDTHDPIIYPASVIADTKQKEAAKDFLQYLQGSEAEKIFVKYGFKVAR